MFFLFTIYVHENPWSRAGRSGSRKLLLLQVRNAWSLDQTVPIKLGTVFYIKNPFFFVNNIVISLFYYLDDGY